jgi:hypothetical protein
LVPSPDETAPSPEIQEVMAETEPSRIDKSVLAFADLDNGVFSAAMRSLFGVRFGKRS